MSAKNYFDLTGNVAVITGCSTGLGVQMAEALANQGANIVCLARRKAKVDENAEMLKAEYGVNAIGVVCDVTDTASGKTLEVLFILYGDLISGWDVRIPQD